jgi:uncharacterized protein with HEPN domain
MSRDPLLFLEDILEASEKARLYLEGVSHEDLLLDAMRLDAVVRNLEIIGEAASRLPDQIRDDLPEVPWRQVVDMRNTLIHAYFGVDPDIVWSVVTEKVGPLAEAIRRHLARRLGEDPRSVAADRPR